MEKIPVHIGTSRWSYTHWHNVLYPPDIRHRLDFYLGQFALLSKQMLLTLVTLRGTLFYDSHFPT